jgi:nucleoside-diphosphate-sugar epimerase
VAEEFSHLPITIGDINNFADCQKAMEGGVDAIHHLAAQPWPVDHPQMRADAGKRGILGCDDPLEHARCLLSVNRQVEQKIKIFVMTAATALSATASALATGPSHCNTCRWMRTTQRRGGSYSYTKHAAEEMLAAFSPSLRYAHILSARRVSATRRGASR